jgi:hypothetical protein
MTPRSDFSIDAEIMEPVRVTPRTVPTMPVVPFIGRVTDGRVDSYQHTAGENHDFQSPDRQDTGSSGSMSLDEMCKVYKLPDWVD